MAWASQASDVGSIPIARSITSDDSVDLRRLKRNRRFQDVLIDAVDYAAGRDFCPATSAARFQGSSSSMRLME